MYYINNHKAQDVSALALAKLIAARQGVSLWNVQDALFAGYVLHFGANSLSYKRSNR